MVEVAWNGKRAAGSIRWCHWIEIRRGRCAVGRCKGAGLFTLGIIGAIAFAVNGLYLGDRDSRGFLGCRSVDALPGRQISSVTITGKLQIGGANANSIVAEGGASGDVPWGT
jgi:hypothetical protein